MNNKHRSRALNKVADALSWKSTLLTTMKSEELGFEFLKDYLCTNPFFGPILDDITSGARSDFGLYNGFLFKGNQLCISNYSLWLKIIQERHNEGHMGQDKMVQLVVE